MAAASVAPAAAAAVVTQASLPTAEELEACYRRCVELKCIIVSRHAGGKEKSQGSYKKHDGLTLCRSMEWVPFADSKLRVCGER